MRFLKKGAIIYIVKMKNVKNDKLTRSCRASALRDATINYIEDGVKTWLRSETVELDMWDVTVKDAYDLGCVIALIEQDQISEAFEKAGELDTLVRDVIPRDVWNWMALVRQEEHNEHWAQLDDGQKYNA